VSAADWLIPASALVGAASGGVLSYFGARAGTRSDDRATEQRELAGRREEWGRRFAAALSLLGEREERDRLIGRALLAQLLDSDLATEEDRATAAQILAADALDAPTAAALRALPSGRGLDSVEFVQDDSWDTTVPSVSAGADEGSDLEVTDLERTDPDGSGLEGSGLQGPDVAGDGSVAERSGGSG
jgi:hypothetical protein